MGVIGCSETSVCNYNSRVCRIPKERSSVAISSRRESQTRCTKSLYSRECYQEDEIKWEGKDGDKINLILGTIPENPGRMALLNWTAALPCCGRDKSL